MSKSTLKVLTCFVPALLIAGSVAIAQQPAPAPANTNQPTNQKPAAQRNTAAVNSGVRANEQLIDSSIPDDRAVEKMLEPYSPRVRALDVVVGKLKGELRKGGTGAGSLGNFVADGMRWQASLKLGRKVDLAIMNGGGIRRSSVTEGDLRARDIFELLPFENALMTLELTGEQIIKLLSSVIARREAQSGARITFVNKPDRTTELTVAKFVDANGDQEIVADKVYTVVTIDYLISVGGDRLPVLREGKNTAPVGITLRDAIMNYVKAETAAGREIKPNLDGRFILDRTNAAPAGETPPQ